jgi:hypothetical protein
MHQNSFFILHEGASELCNYGWRLAADHPTTAVRFVRGRKMRRADSLFDEMAAACQFPYYFGENWPALAECLGDLDWTNSSRFVLVITEFEELLAGQPDELPAFGRALRSAINDYNRERMNLESQDSVFKVLINCGSLDSEFKSPVFDVIGTPMVLRI